MENGTSFVDIWTSAISGLTKFNVGGDWSTRALRKLSSKEFF